MAAEIPYRNLDLPMLAKRLFLGEPRALAFLAFTEAWERFSYYGMTSILVLYISQTLLLHSHSEAVWGLAGFTGTIEAGLGPRSTIGLASQIFGLYTGFVYFTPILGGWVADRFIGRRPAVLLGATLMCAGHLAMAFEASFLAALALLIIGGGLLKGNISAQVGALYRPDDKVGRTRGFLIFSTGINAGAICGPLLIGYLASRLGWHVGFGVAGLLMFGGLATYAAGYRLLGQQDQPITVRQAPQPLTLEERKAIYMIVTIMFITIFQSVTYYQNSNIGLIWISRFVDLKINGFDIPVAWFSSVDPAASVLFVPVIAWLLRSNERTGDNPHEISLIVRGAWIACLANLVLAIASLSGKRVSIMVPLAYDILLGIAFLYYWPTLLAVVSRAAPRRLQATLMGTVFLTLFIANNLIGWIGSFYEQLGPSGFWFVNTAIAATGGVLALLLRAPLTRALSLEGRRPR